MPPAHEKRTAPRITTVVPVHCRITGHGPTVSPSQREAAAVRAQFAAKTVNVSRAGVLINSDTDLIPSTHLEVSFHSPADGRPIVFTADVAWSRRNAMNLFGRYAAGLRMRKIADKDLAVLMEFFKPL